MSLVLALRDALNHVLDQLGPDDRRDILAAEHTARAARQPTTRAAAAA